MKRIVLIGLLLLFFVSLSHAFTLPRCFSAQPADKNAQCNQPFPARQSLSINLHANLAAKSHYTRQTKADTYSYHSSRSPIWLTRDPLNEQGGINMTAFCSNDPINQVDPNGLNPFDPYSNNSMHSANPQLHKLLEFEATSQYDKDAAAVLFYEGVAAKDFVVEIGYFFGDIGIGAYVGGQQLFGSDEAAGNTMLKLEEWGYKGCQLRNQSSGSSYWSSAGNTLKNYGKGLALLPKNIWDNGVGAVEAAKNGDMEAAGYKSGTGILQAASLAAPFAKTPSGGGYQGVGTFKGAWNNLFVEPWCSFWRKSSVQEAGGKAAGTGAKAKFVRLIDDIGDPDSYWNKSFEQLITEIDGGDCALWKGGAHSIEVPRGTSHVMHTHPTSTLPSPADFMMMPKNVAQFIQTPKGGVIFIRTGDFSGVFTAPGTGAVRGSWSAWGGFKFR